MNNIEKVLLNLAHKGINLFNDNVENLYDFWEAPHIIISDGACGVLGFKGDTVKMLFEKTQTATGLKVFVRILDKQFDVGIKVKKHDIDFNRIQFNPKIPELSYTIAA